jgi:prepilin-type N-terminal cleavage/methylation domain-containing protein
MTPTNELNPAMNNVRKPNPAFTLIELIVVITVIAVMMAWLLPALAYTKPKAQRLVCSNNLKQIAVSFRTWASANGGSMPQSVPRSQGGDADDVGFRTLSAVQATSRGVSKIFLTMSNELNAPAILFCPAESEISYRQAATTFAGTVVAGSGALPYTNDLNVSYFIGVDATETAPRMLLAGDHNLGGNANPPTTQFLSAPNTGSAFLSLGTNWTVNQGPAWLDSMHAKQGNVAMADASVEWFSRTNLQNALKLSGDKGRSPGSFTLATGAYAGAGCNRIQLP